MAAPQHPEAFVRWLRQVTPYVHAFRGRTFVVGFGGEMFAESARLGRDLAQPAHEGFRVLRCGHGFPAL